MRKKFRAELGEIPNIVDVVCICYKKNLIEPLTNSNPLPMQVFGIPG